ncbi:MAG: RluA family pseudouridine synthase, partial [Bacteroidota bacterium]|nr:RluA family pseudouridine synthase [Bacteroidota bacterium]
MSGEEFYEEGTMSEEGQEDLYEHFSVVVDPKQQPLRIDKFITQRIANASRNRIQNAITAGNVVVNGEPVKANYKVRSQDKIAILLPQPPRDTEVYPENIPLDIVYEDDYLLIVNKSAVMFVHPGFNNYTGTLVNALTYHFDNLPTAQGERRPGLVHRIDKDTSGLLVIAKDEFSLSHLARQFFEHSIERSYWALAWGSFEERSGTINVNVARHKKDRRIQDVYFDEDTGKHAITHYTVLEEFLYTTLVECRLETGRTHQIRIHMKYLGHPLFNDSAYGGSEMIAGPRFSRYEQFIRNCFDLCPRQALHARSLAFTHPHTKIRLSFVAPLPPDMAALVEKWRAYTA